MSLFVQHLNADTTFLLTFAPPFAPEKHAAKFPGSFTILLDPWLSGISSILHPRFQISKHVCESSIKSLAELRPLPDLIVISQDKPDHCHRATLCSLPNNTKVRILATPAAAKKIRSWGHFKEECIQVMKPFTSKQPDTLFRASIEPYSTFSTPGEITLANIPTKRDMTGLHNAIGITYRPPGTALTAKNGSYIDLTSMDAMTPPQTPRPSTAGPAGAGHLRTTFPSTLRPSPLADEGWNGSHTPPDTPTPSEDGTQHRVDSVHSRNATPPGIPLLKPLSVIYTPHGVTPSTLAPYVKTHLQANNALPLDVLFHSINVEQNPWLLGGVVANGAPGGLAIARQLHARHWISAHDEAKENRGLATVWIKSRHYTAGDVEDMLRMEEGEEGGGAEVHVLDVGARLRIASELRKYGFDRTP